MATMTADNQPYTLVTLDPFSASMLANLQHHVADVFASVKQLKQAGRSKPVGATEEGDRSDTDSE